jgi:DNA polymerase I-like protein with 3'-5' exonuclease and polymerase domains
MNTPILFLGTVEDKHYLTCLRQSLAGEQVRINLSPVDMLSEVAMLCKPQGIKYVVTTQRALIPRLCSTASSKDQIVDNYQGNLLYDSKHDLHFLIVSPLKQTMTVPYGQFLLDRYCSKITKPGKWIDTDSFNWEILGSGDSYEAALSAISSAILVAVDIETRKDLSMSCISYTCLTAAMTTRTFVVPLPYKLPVSDYEYRFAYIAKFNATATPKVGQNFKYDISYLHRYHCPVTGWLWDTMVMHHSYYCELPKDLGTISSFYLRSSVFWKNEGDSGNEHDLYHYNALDTWNTLWVMLAWLAEAPKYARDNYLQEFPVLIPCVLAEATGLLVDMVRFKEIQADKTAEAERERLELGQNLATPNFNPGSHKQVKELLTIIGCKDLATSSDDKTLKKCAYRHPYNEFLVDKITAYRKAAKLVSTYLKEDKIFCGRILYGLSPYGTDTGRLSSKSHNFWTGLQIQNIPRDGGVKEFMVADPGFLLGECDYAQNESRTTGYITGDTVLIDNVESDLDFHKSNASMFFGVAYDAVTKDLRQLAKPVNHGANYNMGPEVLVDTMGLINIFKAAKMLRLPSNYTARQVGAYLLGCFARTYKIVTNDYKVWIKYQVETHRLLRGATGWTRYCFGNPSKSKPSLNAYIAHPPQSLGAMLLNKAYVRVFNEVWIPHSANFKLCAQIHDSILFQYREGHEYLADMVAVCMTNETVVTDLKGTARTMVVPVDLSIGGKSWQDSKEH